MDYYGVVFAHLATGRGINAKDPSGMDSDGWIPHSRCCENPARAKALAGFSRHLSVGFTDLNPAPRGLSLYNPIRAKFLVNIAISRQLLLLFLRIIASQTYVISDDGYQESMSYRIKGSENQMNPHVIEAH